MGRRDRIYDIIARWFTEHTWMYETVDKTAKLPNGRDQREIDISALTDAIDKHMDDAE